MFGKKKEGEQTKGQITQTEAAREKGGLKRGLLRMGRWMKRHKKVTALFVILVIAAGVGIRFQQRRQQMKELAESRNVVETAAIEKQTLVDSISLSGTVASADSRSVTTSVEKAEVTKVYVEVGDTVTAGQVICEFDSEDIERNLANAQNSKILSDYKDDKNYQNVVDAYTDAVEGSDEVYDTYHNAQANAKSAWASAQEAVTAAQNAYDAAAADEAAKQAAFQAAADPKITEAEYGDAKNKLNALLASGEDAAGNSEVADPLDSHATESGGEEAQVIGTNEEEKARYEEIINSYESYQSLKSAYETAVQAAASAKAALEKAKSQESSAGSAYEKIVEERSSAEDKAEETLETAQDNLETANMERKYAVDESGDKIEEYEQQLEDCYLTSPIDGVIVSLSVEEGDVYSGGEIFVVADYDSFIVNATVDEYDISSLEKGMEAAVKVEAAGDEEMAAQLTYVAPSPTTNTSFGSSGSATYSIEISILEPNEKLRIGMSAQASVVLESAQDVLTVPYDCVETDAEGNSHIYVQENGERKEVAVTVGMEGDYYVEVSGEGLFEGMQVYLGTSMVSGGTGSGTDSEEAISFDLGGGMNGGGPGGGGGNRNGGSPGGGNGGAPAGGGGAPGGF